MKVYVDELPKKCIDCPCYDCELGCCNISSVDLQIDENFNRYKQIHKDCPIQTISDHDKQVRKQVCDEVREIFNFGGYEKQFANPEIRIKYNTFVNVLDKIEKGE